MDKIGWFGELNSDDFIAAVNAANKDRVLIVEDIVSSVDKDTKLEGTSTIVGDIKIYDIVCELQGYFCEAGLIERQGVTHLDALGGVGDVNLEGEYVRGEGEQMVRCGFVDEEVVLDSLSYFGVLDRDVRVDV